MILVTGATGLVGGNLMWYLLQENERVCAIRRTTSKLESLRTIFGFYTQNPDKYLDRIDWKTADVLDYQSIVDAMTGIKTVYHCAAVVSLGNGLQNLIDTNVEGTKNIVKACLEKGDVKMCFVSSIAACGKETNGELINENTPWQKNDNQSLYAKSKFNSELEVWNGIEQGLNAVIVNPGVILGISGKNTGSSQLFTQVHKGLAFYTNGGSGYVDVRDVAKAMIKLTNSKIKAERFILVAKNCSNKEILSWMADSFGKPRPFIPIGKNLLEIIGYLSEKIGKLFNLKPLIDRGTAKSATGRSYYSSNKIQETIDFKFSAIEKCIQEVCKYF